MAPPPPPPPQHTRRRDGATILEIDRRQLIIRSHQVAMAAAGGGPSRLIPSHVPSDESSKPKTKLGIIRIKIPPTLTPTPTPLGVATNEVSGNGFNSDNIKKATNNGPCIHECHRGFESRKALGGHILHRHPRNSNNNNTAIVIAPPPPSPPKRPTMENLKHDREQEVIRAHKCLNCNMMFSKRTSLLIHIKDCHYQSPPPPPPPPPQQEDDDDNNNSIITTKFQAPPPIDLAQFPPPNPNNPSRIVAAVPNLKDVASNIIPSLSSWGKKAKRRFFTNSPQDPELEDIADTLVQLSSAPVIFKKDEGGNDLKKKRRFISLSKKERIRDWVYQENLKKKKKINLHQLIIPSPVQQHGAGTSPLQLKLADSIVMPNMRNNKRSCKYMSSITSASSSSIASSGDFSNDSVSEPGALGSSSRAGAAQSKGIIQVWKNHNQIL